MFINKFTYDSIKIKSNQVQGVNNEAKVIEDTRVIQDTKISN